MSEAKPDGLLAQWELLCAVIDSAWAKRLDHKVTRHIIQRYRRDYKNAIVAHRYLERTTGASRPKIINSLRKLIAHGVFSVLQPASGTRPTKYGVNFAFAEKVTSGTQSVPATSGTQSIPAPGTQTIPASAPSGTPEGTESFLPDRLTSRNTVERTSHAAPTAPPTGGLEPASAETARGPEKLKADFNELWDAFNNKHERSKAWTAYKQLAPTPELHERLVAAATAWATAYCTNGTDKRFKKRLHNWLGEECWEEDAPLPYVDAKDAAAVASAKRAGGKRSKKPTGVSHAVPGLSANAPLGRHAVEITFADIIEIPNRDMWLKFRFRTLEDSESEFEHEFLYIDHKDGCDEIGAAVFGEIRKAISKEHLDDISELVGQRISATLSNAAMKYEPYLSVPSQEYKEAA